MGRWRAALVGLFVVAMSWLIIGVVIKSKLAGKPAIFEVTGKVIWAWYDVSQPADGVGWQLKANDGKSYILDNPPQEIAKRCGMCKFQATMRLMPSHKNGDAQLFKVLEVVSLTAELCEH